MPCQGWSTICQRYQTWLGSQLALYMQVARSMQKEGLLAGLLGPVLGEGAPIDAPNGHPRLRLATSTCRLELYCDEDLLAQLTW